MYATIKEIIRLQGGPDVGGVRAPLAQLTEADKEIAKVAQSRLRSDSDYIARWDWVCT